jgi:hypothetical protein
MLGYPIEPAPDEWDRLYNVDFYVEIASKYIGLQIKPVTFHNMPEKHKWNTLQATTHEKFKSKLGGKVFTVFSAKQGTNKIIQNLEIVDQIKKEITRLEGLKDTS